MKTLLLGWVLAVALTAQGQLPCNNFDAEYARQHWTEAYTDNNVVYYNESSDPTRFNTWSYLPSKQMFVYLFSEDAYGYRSAIREFDKLPGRIADESFFPGYIDSFRDYNNVETAVSIGSAEVRMFKNFDSKQAVILFNKDSAVLMVTFDE